MAVDSFMSRPTKIEINLNHLRHNLSVVKTCAGEARVMAVIKADAYGHGAARIAKALSLQGQIAADAFAVASVEEALVLRDAGIQQRIVLLEGFFDTEELEAIVQKNLDIVIHSESQLAALLKFRPKFGPKVGQSVNAGLINVWLKVDTGMQRLGLSPDTAITALEQLKAASTVDELRLLTHFACADTPEHPATLAQFTLFNQLPHEGLETSLANSAALVAHPVVVERKKKGLRTLFARKLEEPDFLGDWVRPGIMLYGANPMADEHPMADKLRPVMTLSSRIIATRLLKPGESTGYGKDWVADHPMRIGIVAVGYGDGYPRHASTGTPVLIAGKPAQLLGRVSMDMLAVDLSELPEQGEGDAVTLWGEGLPVWEVARHAGTISYELLTGVAQRVGFDVVGVDGLS